MLILKNLLLATATLILVETVAVTPAQAFTLTFQSTDGKVTGNIVSPDSGMSTLSLLGQGWSFSGSLVSYPGIPSMAMAQAFGQIQVSTLPNLLNLPNIELVNNMPPDLPHIWPILARTNTNVSLSLLCLLESNCLDRFGAISLNMSFVDSGTNRLYSWNGYGGQIKVTAWNPTGTSIPITPPTSSSTSIPTTIESSHSVPEPSSVFALLLLGTGWLLRRKLAVG